MISALGPSFNHLAIATGPSAPLSSAASLTPLPAFLPAVFFLPLVPNKPPPPDDWTGALLSCVDAVRWDRVAGAGRPALIRPGREDEGAMPGAPEPKEGGSPVPEGEDEVMGEEMSWWW